MSNLSLPEALAGLEKEIRVVIAGEPAYPGVTMCFGPSMETLERWADALSALIPQAGAPPKANTSGLDNNTSIV